MADYFQQQHKEIGDLTNAKFWDAEHRIYNDVRENGKPITEPKDGGGICKHGFIFWPLLAEIAPPDRVAAMVAEASNPNTFYRGSGIASLSGDSEHFTGGAEGTGHYWHGAVWPPIQCMVQEGLRVNDRRDLARQFAERYYTAVIEAYVKQHDITENLAPDRPLAGGCGKFVGWGGVAPVANLIEYILGFDINVPDQRVVWHIDRTERHGLKNLWLGSFSADMLCQARTTAEAPCRLSVTNRGPFTLVVVTPRGKTEHKITPGDHEIVVE
jgi:glycogen debranching enzyme